MKKRIMLIVLFSIFIFFMGSVFAVENDTGISSDMKTTDSTSNSHNYYSDNGKEYSNRFQKKH